MAWIIPACIYLMGPDGRLVSFYDEAISPDDLAKDLRTSI